MDGSFHQELAMSLSDGLFRFSLYMLSLSSTYRYDMMLVMFDRALPPPAPISGGVFCRPQQRPWPVRCLVVDHPTPLVDRWRAYDIMRCPIYSSVWLASLARASLMAWDGIIMFVP